mmetsp:Transcript_17453/g.41930  ORF Transcript_17453/g.41930 Transcript_17453/m.41930 type:complete len:237 (-) Transcript_17453:1458-2168(-)
MLFARDSRVSDFERFRASVVAFGWSFPVSSLRLQRHFLTKAHPKPATLAATARMPPTMLRMVSRHSGLAYEKNPHSSSSFPTSPSSSRKKSGLVISCGVRWRMRTRLLSSRLMMTLPMVILSWISFMLLMEGKLTRLSRSCVLPVSKSRIVTSPGSLPMTKLSAPLPPISWSSPPRPSSRSAPSPPMRVLLWLLPRRVSSCLDPSTVAIGLPSARVMNFLLSESEQDTRTSTLPVP